jgi:hypothetical protein
MERLPVQEDRLQQVALGSLEWEVKFRRPRPEVPRVLSGRR